MDTNTDVFSIKITATGLAYPARTRVRQICIDAAVGGTSVTLRDGGAAGPIIFDGTFPASVFSRVPIPGKGLLFSTSIHATITSVTSVTLQAG